MRRNLVDWVHMLIISSTRPPQEQRTLKREPQYLGYAPAARHGRMLVYSYEREGLCGSTRLKDRTVHLCSLISGTKHSRPTTRWTKKNSHKWVSVCGQDYQPHVRVDAVNVGGFHCIFSGSIRRRRFSFCFSLCSMSASGMTIL